MAWLSRVNFTASDVLSYTDLNNLGNDIRAWGGNVNGGAYTLSNVVLSASSGTMATVIGGTGTTSTLTLRSTSGVGTTGADIIFQAGNNGATEVMRLQNGGNVGIGTTNPQSGKLNVYGKALIGAYDSAAVISGGQLELRSAGATESRLDIWQSGVALGSLGSPASSSVFYIVNNYSATGLVPGNGIAIATDGKVGIGTSSPAGKLDIVTGVYRGYFDDAAGSLFRLSAVNAANSAYGPLSVNGSVVTFQISASEKMRLDSSGNVGIGTASNAGNTLRYLDVQNTDTGSSAGVIIRLITSNSAGTGSNTVDLVRYKTGLFLINNNDSSGIIAINNAGSERMRIDSVGNVKVGGTADRATTAGTNQVVIFNGTAPVGTLANGCSFYSTAGEMRVMDAAGNATLLSPHDSVTNEWIYDSSHTPSGKRLKINVERLLRFINDHFGLDCVHDLMEQA